MGDNPRSRTGYKKKLNNFRNVLFGSISLACVRQTISTGKKNIKTNSPTPVAGRAHLIPGQGYRTGTSGTGDFRNSLQVRKDKEAEVGDLVHGPHCNAKLT